MELYGTATKLQRVFEGQIQTKPTIGIQNSARNIAEATHWRLRISLQLKEHCMTLFYWKVAASRFMSSRG